MVARGWLVYGREGGGVTRKELLSFSEVKLLYSREDLFKTNIYIYIYLYIYIHVSDWTKLHQLSKRLASVGIMGD